MSKGTARICERCGTEFLSRSWGRFIEETVRRAAIITVVGALIFGWVTKSQIKTIGTQGHSRTPAGSIADWAEQVLESTVKNFTNSRVIISASALFVFCIAIGAYDLFYKRRGHNGPVKIGSSCPSCGQNSAVQVDSPLGMELSANWAHRRNLQK
jgi:hypothetical protein